MKPEKERIKHQVLRLISWIFILPFIFQFCSKDWENHYSNPEDTVGTSLWDAIKQEPKYSLYVSYMEKYKMDTIFNDKKSFTLFIPPDNTLQAVPDTGDFIPKLLAYHISPSVFLVRNVTNWKKLLTQSGKYILIQYMNGGHRLDDIPVVFESPLYLNGKFYEIAEPAIPRPNLYEFTAQYSEVIKEFIDLQDSSFLDLKASKPIGFDQQGNTIYDSVVSTVNLFEKYFFPVSTEFRDKSATFILFTQEQYTDALNEMAARLKGNFTNWEDIPADWQFNILMPEMMRIGMFDNSLEYTDLMKDSIKNVTGEMVKIQYGNIDPLSKFDCSNGVVYNYSSFSVPLDMYLNNIRLEGENLVDSIGAGRFAWKNDVKVTGAIVEPVRQITVNESLVSADLGRNFKGQYTVEFTMKNVWPGKYRFVWRANYRPSGLFAVYVNGVKLGQYDTYNLRQTVISVTGERFSPSSSGFNRKDFWVNNISDYGDVNVKFEYLGSGVSSTNGFNIDYVELIPVLE